ncbi:hypothetical protein M404DRAFT_17856 [Pisolithus tinctorius Marx 270]|uniref:Uncharacterized protein n=1 Tax=Pisolithus tinctorius Marx 270 TaxID=870435 RepID=A0A0C3KZR5_PISTI|nr:hypothetical protein M404DRAFT_17856 [Pisolithus tinctorius Marx 270]
MYLGKSHLKDAKASLKAAGRVNKGKKWKVDKETPEPGPSKKWVKVSVKLIKVLDLNEPKAGGSRLRESNAVQYSGLEGKLNWLIDAMGLIANNLASLFKLHKTAVENSSQITGVLEALLNESYGFRMVVSPADLGSSELDSNELCKEADWLKTHSKDEEEEAKGEDETMAKAK